MGTEPATEARHKHHFTPEIQVAVAKARRRGGGLRTAWRARMVGEIPYGILRCEAEKRRLMLARIGSSWTLAEDGILDPLAGMASLETIQRKLARTEFH